MLERPLLGRIAGACLLLLVLIRATGAVELINEQEARLPDDATEPKGIFRGPKVMLVNPAAKAGLIKSPFNLKLKFESYGGTRIDPDSILVTYRKWPPIDLTQRIKPFIRVGGIDVENAEAPPGEHRIRVDVLDGNGQRGSLEFTIRVAK